MVWRSLILLSLGLAGCSFQSDRAAPVETLYTGNIYSDREKGSVSGSRYKVQPGDTLYSIAWASDQDFRQLARINDLRSPYTIFPGQNLRLISEKSSAKRSPPVAKVNPVKPRPSKVSAPLVTEKDQKTEQKKTVDPKKQSRYAGSATSQSGNKKPVVSQTALPSRVAKWQWPVKGTVIRRFSAGEQGNKGLDIAAVQGTPVSSAAEGKVVYAGNALRGYGKLVIIKHSDDFLSAYAHNSKILVKEQQRVRAGQAVAEVGSTDADRSMLHFEIRYQGKSVDPMRYLPR